MHTLPQQDTLIYQLLSHGCPVNI